MKNAVPTFEDVIKARDQRQIECPFSRRVCTLTICRNCSEQIKAANGMTEFNKWADGLITDYSLFPTPENMGRIDALRAAKRNLARIQEGN